MEFEDIFFDTESSIDIELVDNEYLIADEDLPSNITIIPIKYRPVFPGTITPLIISNNKYIKIIENIMANSQTVGVVMVKDDEKEDIEIKDLYEYGTVAKIFRKMNLPDGGMNVLINSVKRFKIKKSSVHKGQIVADVEYLNDILPSKKNIVLKALTKEVLSKLKLLSDDNPLFTEEMKLTMINVDEPGRIADYVISILNVEKEQYQKVLETINVKSRLSLVLAALHKELDVMTIQKKIQTRIDNRVDKQQRDYFLREQLKEIKVELGMEDDEQTVLINEMKEKAKQLTLIDEVKEKIESEISKLSNLELGSSEYTVSKNYLDTIFSLPWNKKTEDSIDLDKAEKILNSDHYGLEDVKERIIEFLAVKKIKQDSKGSIICLVGPPGVGKTSLGRSIARALGRKFFRMSLGGMRDEAEIKGHRRTYIGAMPGKIMEGLKISKSNNPVFMLDEIDKLGQSFQGDPASALLEVLDPEQNSDFRDHYLDLPFNLSNVLFIATANTTDTIPDVLADRMETIRLSGYIFMEKFEIAKRYLLTKQLKAHGLKKGDVKIDRKGYLNIIDNWARESGVRSLERRIEQICRKTTTLIAKNKKIPNDKLSNDEIRNYLGPEIFSDEEILQVNKPGIVIGLAWTSLGGVTMAIESLGVSCKNGGSLKLTGQLGKVMSESANIAYSHIRHLLNDSESSKKYFEERIIHLHVPAGATPKDGPSAGITMATSIYSLVTGKTIKKGIAMTGELTLSGKVFPVGGIREKVIAAKQANIKDIIIPKENNRDLEEIPDYIKKGLTFFPVSDIQEVIDIAYNKNKRK